MVDFFENLKEKAKTLGKRIVLPEALDSRILSAAREIVDSSVAIPILVGKKDEIESFATSEEISLDGIDVVDISTYDKLDLYVEKLYEVRKHKGMTPEKARELLFDVSYFGTMMVFMGDADGLVSGATHSTADTIRPALQIVKMKEGAKMASSFFLMIKEEGQYIFSDCGVVINPSAEELSEIAIAAAGSARAFGIDPKVAMLSFSTKGSANDPLVDKVVRATEILGERNVDFVYDGEVQLDSAIVPSVAAKKCPDSPLKGEANVLVFPDLNSGNIGYKLVQRLGGYMAIGPIMQGLKKPINDLSRGCSVSDIVDLVIITALQSE